MLHLVIFWYSLYYHFFRKAFDPFILILVAVIIVIVLFFILYLIVTVSYTDLVYPILDAVLIFPALLIFLAVGKIRIHKNAELEKQRIRHGSEVEGTNQTKSFHPIFRDSSLWILLLSISMILSAIGDIGYAYSTALGPEIALRDLWIWNIIFNTDHLCLAGALIGYRHFFSFNRIDTLQH